MGGSGGRTSVQVSKTFDANYQPTVG
uniref:Uncharacterized protein n=1 Tax=Amphimedon queenslandica TaxID=400682 RepID=A0A1X7SFL8_AMPQE